MCITLNIISSRQSQLNRRSAYFKHHLFGHRSEYSTNLLKEKCAILHDCELVSHPARETVVVFPMYI